MTKTTEELKREMYGLFDLLKFHAKHVPTTVNVFESALEAYLEALRQEAVNSAKALEVMLANCSAIRDGYMHQVSLTMEARAEADRERNRAQAFEFANKSAGEFLQAAQDKVKRQRQSIGQLKNDRNNAQSLAAVHYAKYQKARQELAELSKSIQPKQVQVQLDGYRSGAIGSNGEACTHTWANVDWSCEVCRRKFAVPACAHTTDPEGICIYCRQKVGGVEHAKS